MYNAEYIVWNIADGQVELHVFMYTAATTVMAQGSLFGHMQTSCCHIRCVFVYLGLLRCASSLLTGTGILLKRFAMLMERPDEMICDQTQAMPLLASDLDLGTTR